MQLSCFHRSWNIFSVSTTTIFPDVAYKWICIRCVRKIDPFVPFSRRKKIGEIEKNWDHVFFLIYTLSSVRSVFNTDVAALDLGAAECTNASVRVINVIYIVCHVLLLGPFVCSPRFVPGFEPLAAGPYSIWFYFLCAMCIQHNHSDRNLQYLRKNNRNFFFHLHKRKLYCKEFAWNPIDWMTNEHYMNPLDKWVKIDTAKNLRISSSFLVSAQPSSPIPARIWHSNRKWRKLSTEYIYSNRSLVVNGVERRTSG